MRRNMRPVDVKVPYYNEFVSTFVWISLLPNTWKTVLFNIQKDSALSDKKKNISQTYYSVQ